jgi:hypothetical protein
MKRAFLCRCLVLISIITGSLIAMPVIHAQVQWGSVGEVVSTDAIRYQRHAVIPDGRGGVIIAWIEGKEDARSIHAQRINSDGAAVWAAGGVVVCSDAGEVKELKAASDGAGGGIVAWEDHAGENNRVYVQSVNENGTTKWGVGAIPICTVEENEGLMGMVSDGSGGAIVAWSGNRSGKYWTYAQRLNAWGGRIWNEQGAKIAEEHSSGISFPKMVCDGAGGAILAFFAGSGICAVKITASGIAAWLEQVEKVSPWDLRYHSLINDGAGGAIIAWDQYRGSNKTDFDIYAQRIDSQGVKRWGESGLPVCVQPNPQYKPELTSDGKGGAIVAWSDYRFGWVVNRINTIYWENPAVFAQRIDFEGNPMWIPDGVAVASGEGGRSCYGIAQDGTGGALVTWWGSGALHCQKIDARGNVIWGVDGETIGPGGYDSITYDGSHGAIITWSRGGGKDDETVDILAQKVLVDGFVPPPSGRTCATSSTGTARPGKAWYLAEGATDGGFETWVLLYNPGEQSAHVTLTYNADSGEVPGPGLTLAPGSRQSVNVGDTILSYNVSTRVASDQLVVVERSTYYDNRTCATSSTGVAQPAKTWYLAEGAAGGGFETWVLLYNPGEQAARVALTYHTDKGEVHGPELTLPPGSRQSVNVGDTIQSYNASTRIDSNQPVVVERSTYYDNRTCATSSTGIAQLANTWYLAEGATDGGFETWVLLYNPGEQATHVTLTYHTDKGEVPGPELTLAPGSRQSLNVGDTIQSYNVSTRVASDQPVAVERSTYYDNRNCATSSTGVAWPEMTWYLAEGASDGGFETWVLIYNPGEQAAHVNLTYHTDSGEVPGPELTLAPGSRQSVNVGATIQCYDVSTRIVSDQPVVAERSTYK